jgi:hypothetical protein
VDTKPEIPAYYGFTDVHGFKDFLVAVLCEAPDMFMELDWLPPDQQMNLERAFDGLRHGFALVEWEFDAAKAAPMRQLADEALAAYRRGDDRGGQAKLEAVEKLLRCLRTQ